MSRNRVVSDRLRDRVVVTCKSGTSFGGVLFEADDKALVLRQASALGAGENKSDLPLDGEIIVLLADVAYMQRV